MESNRPSLINNDLKPIRRTLGLLLTYKCNLDCTYCYVLNKRELTMSLETAQKAIKDAFLDINNPFDELEIDFMGGEPLYVFNELREISEWVWSQCWEKPYILFATTNGTLLNGEMKTWFTDNKDKIVLGLSYDGEQTAHNVNRSNSLNIIDVDFFLQTWPSQPLKMTISEESVEYLAENVIGLHNIRAEFTANCALGMPTWRDISLAQYSHQLCKLIDYYAKHPHIVPINLLNINLIQVLRSPEDASPRHCGAGKYFYVIDCDGSKSPCHLFSALALSDEKRAEADNLDFFNRDDCLINECKDCVLNILCPICYGMSLIRLGNPFKREKSICRLFKIQILANCKLQAKRIFNKDYKSPRDREVASSIKRILSTINKEG